MTLEAPCRLMAVSTAKVAPAPGAVSAWPQSRTHPRALASLWGATLGVVLLRAMVPAQWTSLAGLLFMAQVPTRPKAPQLAGRARRLHAVASGWLCPCDASPLGNAPSVVAPVSRHRFRALPTPCVAWWLPAGALTIMALGLRRGARRTCP